MCETATPDAPTDEASRTTPLDELQWTVVGVAFDDTLNVRADPDASALIVGELDPWSTDFTVTGDVDGPPVRWYEVELPDGTTGWVNARFVVGQPTVLDAAAREALTDHTVDFIDWFQGDIDGDAADDFLAHRAVFVGGIAIYADIGSEWNWIDGATIDDLDDWDRPREFVVEDGFDCGADCVISLREFLTLDRIDDTSRVLINDIPDGNNGFLEGALWEAPETMHRVVVDTPTTDPQDTFDWQRLHIVHDWSQGEPRIHLIHNHGWTP